MPTINVLAIRTFFALFCPFFILLFLYPLISLSSYLSLSSCLSLVFSILLINFLWTIQLLKNAKKTWISNHITNHEKSQGFVQLTLKGDVESC